MSVLDGRVKGGKRKTSIRRDLGGLSPFMSFRGYSRDWSSATLELNHCNGVSSISGSV